MLSPRVDAISDFPTGSLKPEGMITKVVKLDKTVEDGFHTLINEKDKHVKILVEV